MAHQLIHDAGQLFVFDIETVPGYPSFDAVPEQWQSLWIDKVSKIVPENTDFAQLYEEKAGVMAEFARIICISAGVFYKEGNQLYFRIKSFYDDDEGTLLQNFLGAAEAYIRRHRKVTFAGHNIREFDLPFICRRLLILGRPLPPFLDFSGKKPWEVNVVDTLQLWKFGDFKHYTSLRLLAACLGVPSPKQDIDGSRVKEVYYGEKDMQRIVTYCQNDVKAVANILLRMQNLPLLSDANIFVAD